MYKLIANSNNVLRMSDGASIPDDPGNRDYIEYLAWIAQGNTPLPADVPSLAGRQTATWEKIKAERDRRVQSGGYQVGGHWFNSDTFSRTQQLGLVIMGANLPAGIQWKTLDNGFVTMTPTLASQIFQAAAASDMALFAAAIVHQTAMMASQTPETYDYSSGWPAVYGG